MTEGCWPWAPARACSRAAGAVAAGVTVAVSTAGVLRATDGDAWRQLARHLPDVLCVRAVTVG
ncbi:hypothetical protein [Streptomyces buecherae]|uniref:hypothetical protein n=1 Tax=Streptomyces buecherae TaxID=2763006 RepID=UPI001C280631|nr:hypothetical protein [Streptomyces buecherae]